MSKLSAPRRKVISSTVPYRHSGMGWQMTLELACGHRIEYHTSRLTYPAPAAPKTTQCFKCIAQNVDFGKIFGDTNNP